MKPILIIVNLFIALTIHGQPIIKVEVSSDTVSIGEEVVITYTIENGEGGFEIPDMLDLPVISGPNSSSSFVYQNGIMSSNQSYSFTLRPIEEGKLIIPKTSYQTKKEILVIQPVEVIVLLKYDNPGTPKTITKDPSSKVKRETKRI